MEKEETGDYKGKSLEEIELNMEEDLLEETNGADSAVEANINKATDNINEIVSTEPQIQKKWNKRILIPWTDEQKQLAKTFFQKHIQKSQSPKRHECEEFIRKHPQVFNNKNWLKIKVFIQNIYSKK